MQEISAGYDFKVIETTRSNEANTTEVDQLLEDKSETEKSSTDEAAISKKSLGFTPYIFYGQMATWKFAFAGVVCFIIKQISLSMNSHVLS